MAPSTERARITVYTVAERAGVSVATVSRVLQAPHLVRESTRATVLQAIDDLDYVPHGAARSLASSRHEAHGLVLPELGGPYYSELLMGYESVAAEAGHSVILLLTDGKTSLDLQLRRMAGNVDGLVLMGDVGMSSAAIAALRRRIPVLGLTGPAHDGYESFSTENTASAEQLTRHLLGHGRSRLAFVGSPDQARDVRERYAGFVAAHDGAPATDPIEAELRERDGRRVAELILAGDVSTDALVCANDELALAVLDRLVDGGVEVPGDIAVVGWDDVMTARYVRPALTTVAQPVRELGAAAAARMRELIAGAPDNTHEHTLPTTLVIRESCGCPAGRGSPHPSPEEKE